MNTEILKEHGIVLNDNTLTGSYNFAGRMSPDVSFVWLAEIFGKPDSPFYLEEGDFRWMGSFNGQVWEIYNWKNGHAYLGKTGKDNDDMSGEDLSIGGVGLNKEEFIETVENLIKIAREERIKNIKEGKDWGCPTCGGQVFLAKQVCYHDVQVDKNGNWDNDCGVYESENPSSPFICKECCLEYEEIPKGSS